MGMSGKIRRYSELARGVLKGHPGARIARGVKLTGPGTYRLERGSILRKGVRAWVGGGATLHLQRGAIVGERCIINVESGVTMGENSEISWDTQLLDTDFHDITAPDGSMRQRSAPIVLGRRVMIGTGVVVLKGVTLHDGAIVAAGSVVTKSVEAGVVVAGNPARPIGLASTWH